MKILDLFGNFGYKELFNLAGEAIKGIDNQELNSEKISH